MSLANRRGQIISKFPVSSKWRGPQLDGYEVDRCK